MESANVAYAAAVLAIYVVLFVPAVYTMFKHSGQGTAGLGWVFFILFCSVRIVGSALQMANPESTAAAIISSVGLSPLTIAIGGVLNEARYHLLSLRNNPERKKMESTFALSLHAAIIVSIALLATGAAGLQSTADRTDPAKLNKDWNLAGVGGAILFAVIALMFLGAVYTYICHKPDNTRQGLAQRLVVAVGVACPLLAIRIIGSTVFYFSKNLEMSPLNGTWGFRVGLYLVPEVLAACALLAGGLGTRNIGKGGEVREDAFRGGKV